MTHAITRSFLVNLDEVLSFSNFMCNLEFFNFRVSIDIYDELQQPPPTVKTTTSPPQPHLFLENPEADDDFELPAMADAAHVDVRKRNLKELYENMRQELGVI
ncbi:hypothetical protein SESBI_03179 [Sesbania bispinosa]|nr:hypothetical protein SESBI_03179 [Sesbania bispinosa]